MTITKVGKGTLTLQSSAASTYTGYTTVAAGTLQLDYSAATATTTDMINKLSPLQLIGGTLEVLGRAGANTAQTFGIVALNAGGGKIVINGNNTATYTTTLTTGAITGTTGGTLLISVSNASQDLVKLGSTLTSVNSRYVYTSDNSNYNWAVNTAAGQSTTGYGSYVAFPTSGTSTSNTRITAASTSLTAADTVNTLKIETTAGGTLDLAGNTLTLTANGLLVTGSSDYVISNGTLSGATAASELVIQQFSTGTLTISSTLTTGTQILTKGGTGQLTLSGISTSTGATYLNGGTLSISSASNIGSGALSLAGDTTFATTADVTLANTVTLRGYTTLSAAAGTTMNFTAAMGGAGGLTIAGDGTVKIGGIASTFTGAINILSGSTLQAGISTFLSGTGGTVTVDGTLDMTNYAVSVGGLAGSGSVIVSAANATRTLTVGGNHQSTTFSGTMSTTTSSLMALSKTGYGTLTMSGTNTFTGGVTVLQGTLRIDGENVLAANNALALGNNAALNNAVFDLNGHAWTSGAITFYGSTSIATSVAAINIGSGGVLTLNGNVATASVTTTAGAQGAGIYGGTLALGTAWRTFTTADSPNAAADLTITSAITGDQGIIKAGAGLLLLTGVNTYTGGTTVSAGTLALGGSGTLGSTTATLNVSGATGVVDLNGTNQTVGLLTGIAGASILNSATGTKSTLTIGNGDATGSTYAGNLLNNGGTGGILSLVKTGSGTMTLSGTNNYTGTTTINAGTLQFAKEVSLYNNTPASWTASNIIVKSGASLALNVGGTGEFTSSDLSTILALGTSVGGFQSGSTVALDTTNAGGSFTHSGNISNANTLNLLKIGTGTLVLSGTNSYTGTTTVNVGTLQFAKEVSLYNNTLANWNASNIIVNSGAALALNVGGTGEFTSSDLDTILSLGTSTGGFLSGSSAGLDTTNAGGSFTYASNISNANAMGILKIGTGTLVLSGINTYTGTTTVDAGTLQFAKEVSLYNNTPASWTASNITVNSGATLALNVGGTGEFTSSDLDTILALGTPTGGFLSGSSIAIDTTNASSGFAYAGNISNTNYGGNAISLIKLGTNTLTLTGNNTFSGGVTVAAGTLVMGSAGALNTAGTNALTLNASGVLQLNDHDLTVTSLTGAAGAIVENGGIASNAILTVKGSSSTTYAGVLRDHDGSVIGGKNLGLTVAGSGALALTGSNTYTGNTTIAGGTLALSGDGQLTGTPSMTINNGALTLVNTTSTEGALDRVNDGAGITINGRAQINYTNTATSGNSYAETLGAISLASGQLTIINTSDAVSGTQTLTLGSGSLTHAAGNTSAAAFIGGTTLGTSSVNQILVNGYSATGTGAIIGAWATAGTGTTATDYAKYGANGITYLDAAAKTDDSTWNTAWANNATGNVNFGNTTTGTTLTANRVLNTLRHTGGTETLALSNFSLSLQGLLQGGTGTLTIASVSAMGYITASGNPDYNLFITNDSDQAITIAAPIVDSGTNAVTLVKSGSGTLTIATPGSGTHSFSGGIVLNAGTLSVSADANLGSTSNSITVNGDSTLNTTAAFTMSAARTITINNSSTLTVNAAVTAMIIGARITGTGGISNGATNTAVTLSNTGNDFQGSLWVGQNTWTVYSLADGEGYGAIRLGSTTTAGGFAWGTGTIGGLTLNHRQIELAGTTGGGVFSNNNYNPGNAITVNTGLLVGTAGAKTLTLGGVNTGLNTFAGLIANGADSVIGLTKADAGTWTLTGMNTYTGVTSLSGGILRVSSLSNGGVAGNIGAASNSAGNLVLGAGTLQYTGATTSIDRNFTLTSGQYTTFDVVNAATTLTLTGADTSVGGGIIKDGAGTLVFTGVNLHTGNNQLYRGTLQLSGANGSFATSGTSTLYGGTLVLDNRASAGGDNANRLGNASGLVMSGGSFMYYGSDVGNSTETIGAITGTGAVGFTGSSYATITILPGSSYSATITAASFAHTATNGAILVNGTNLGMDSTTTSSVARLIFTTAPTLVGTTDALVTGIDSSHQNTKIVAALVGEADLATGLGTTTGVANTFLTYNALTGLRPLNPLSEFTQNSIVAGDNTRITSAATASTTAAINSLIMAGGNLSIDDGATLTDTSGALLFTANGSISPSTSTGTLAFGAVEAMIAVNSGVSATISTALTGTAGLTKSGAGTLTIAGVQTYTGSTFVNAGMLEISGSLTNANVINIASGTLKVTGTVNTGATSTGTVTVAGASASRALLLLDGGTLTPYSVALAAGTTSAAGVIVKNSGNLAPTSIKDGSFTSTAGYTGVSISSGTLQTYRYDANSTAVSSAMVTQVTGTGTLKVTEYLLTRNAFSEITIAGSGILNHTSATQTISLGFANSGVTSFNIIGTSALVDNSSTGTARTIYIGESAGTPTVSINMNAGTLITPSFTKSRGTAYINFNGGTLKASAAGTMLASNFSTSGGVYVNGAFGSFNGGATIDTNGFATTIAADLIAPTGSGLITIAVTDGGSGYVGAPYIQINGDGSGATAIANMVDDGTGNGTLRIASITITNPGNNYTAASITLLGGGAATSATVGTVSLAPNTSGGLTKDRRWHPHPQRHQ